MQVMWILGELKPILIRRLLYNKLQFFLLQEQKFHLRHHLLWYYQPILKILELLIFEFWFFILLIYGRSRMKVDRLWALNLKRRKSGGPQKLTILKSRSGRSEIEWPSTIVLELWCKLVGLKTVHFCVTVHFGPDSVPRHRFKPHFSNHGLELSIN